MCNIIIFLLITIFFTSPLICTANESITISNVLNRSTRLDIICDDFEAADWTFDYKKHICYRKFWHPSYKGEPELLRIVTAPDGGKLGSTRALEIRTNKSDNDSVPTQEDLLTGAFGQYLGRNLTRADQPVFIVRVWLPPFDQWGDYYNFGFRQAAHSSNLPSQQPEYYPSIWLRYSKFSSGIIKSGAYFYFRIGTGSANDVCGPPIAQSGWWTIAIAFDEKGIGRYYACSGIKIPTIKDEIFNTTQFISTNGTNNPFMDDIAYSFFSLGYQKSGNTSVPIVIDDYEVWVVSNSHN